MRGVRELVPPEGRAFQGPCALRGMRPGVNARTAPATAGLPSTTRQEDP